MISRSTNIRAALRSRQRGFILNPYAFGGSSAPSAPSRADVQALFAGTNGAFYDMTDASTMWANTARTVPAVADGIVLGLTDVSGNNYHLSDASCTARMRTTLGSASGVGLDFVKSGQALVSASAVTLGSSSGYTLIDAIDIDASTTNMATLGADHSTARIVQATSIIPTSRNYMLRFRNNNNSTFDSINAGHNTIQNNIRVILVRKTTTTGLYLYRNGSLVGYLASASTFAARSSFLSLGADFAGTTSASYNQLDGRLYASAIFGRALSNSEISTVVQHFASIANITDYQYAAYEDLTAYTETDPSTYISISGNSRVNANSFTRNIVAHVAKDFGVGYFNGDLEFDFNFSVNTDVDGAYLGFGFLSNNVSSIDGMPNCLGFAYHRPSSATKQISIVEKVGGVTTTVVQTGLALNTIYYCKARLVRSEGISGRLYLHTATSYANRKVSSWWNTISLDLTAALNYRYFIPAVSLGSGTGTITAGVDEFSFK